MDPNATVVLRYSRSVLVTGCACIVFFGIGALSSALHPETISGCSGRPVTPTEMFLVAGAFVAFTILGAYLAAYFFLERHELSRDGLATRTVLGRWKRIAWSDLRSVDYCQYPKAWFRLEDASQTVIRISFALNGLSAFAELLLEQAPTAAMDGTTLAVLRAVAVGHPPPMRLV